MGRKFVFQHNYKSGIGVWMKGDVQELTKEEAEHLLRDSPGVIKPESKGKAKAEDGPTGPTGSEGETGSTGPTGSTGEGGSDGEGT